MFVTGELELDWSNLISLDGLQILASIMALFEVFISKRNWLSKKLNNLIVANKIINYRIDIMMKNIGQIDISVIANELEQCISEELGIQSLIRKPISSFNKIKWSVHYEPIGCAITYAENINSTISLRIEGVGKYGKISSHKKDVLYFTGFIRIFSSYFFQIPNIQNKIQVEKIEVIINKEGSQIKQANVWNEGISEVDIYEFKITKNIKSSSEIIINNQEIKLSVTKYNSLYDDFIELTNIICAIE